MNKFVSVKTIKLDFLEPREKWAECYLEIASLTLGEVEEMASFKDVNKEKASDFMINLLKDKLIGGRGWNGKEVVDIKKEDVVELPFEAISSIFEKLTGELGKKK